MPCLTWLRTLALGVCAGILASINTAGAQTLQQPPAQTPPATDSRAPSETAPGAADPFAVPPTRSAMPAETPPAAAPAETPSPFTPERAPAATPPAGAPTEAPPAELPPAAPKQAAPKKAAPQQPDTSKIYRLDADAGLKPIALADLKLKRVYYAYNPRLGRHAWSSYLGNGQFWHAFGIGSIQPVRMFDLDLTPAEGLERLRTADPYLARMVSTTGEPVFVRLNNEGRWRLLDRSSVPRIFDAETGVEWEAQFGRYIPVVRLSNFGGLPW